MRIFLSYGHDKYASLAGRIKRDLEAAGHEVWFDLERLKPGGDWERYIEEGFEFVSKDSKSGRFLLLMTPHSVRRPDASEANRRNYGYCLNEVARAYSRNLPIIPVMVADVEPPLSICSLQWLDMRQCFPAEQHEEQYKKQFGRLLVGLEKLVPFEGVQQRLRSRLHPITYVEDLARHLLRFTGREWAMKEFEGWLGSSRRVLWITGQTGVGKSAIAAWLCDKRPEIAAYHFCRFGNTERTDARRVLFSLAFQLATQLPVFWDRLNASAIDKIAVETNVPSIFDQLFTDLLSDAVPLTDKPHVLLIDGLDEATSNGKNELASLIGHEVKRLPSWLRVIVTSRPYEKEINFALQALDPWKLDAGRQENVQDIREYLDRELRPFTGNGAPSPAVVEQIVDKSEGLFLYVSWVRQELDEGHLSLQDVEKFPQGLGGIYADFFKRYFPDIHEYETVCRPALEAICAVREPIQRNSLASLLGRSEYEMRKLMARLGSLFPVVDGRVRPFHQSVRDWLVDPAPDRSGDYWIDVSAQEERLADLAWQEYRAGVNTMGQYCIKYAPSHLANCNRKGELEKLLLDPGWMQAKLQASDVTGLLADFDLALSVVAPDTSKAVAVNDDKEYLLRLVQHSLRVSAQVLARDKNQLAAQLLGRIPETEPLRSTILQWSLAIRQPWLRPLTASLAAEQSTRWLRPSGEALGDVAFSKNGRWASHVSGKLGEEQNIVLWDLEEWRSVGPRFRALARLNPFALAISNDARWCLYADSIGGVYRLGADGEVWEGHAHRKTTIALWLGISTDGKRALSACQAGRLVAWDIEANCQEIVWAENDNYIRAMSLDATGTRAVVARADGSVALLDLWPIRKRVLCIVEDEPTALAVSIDNSTVAVASANGRIELRLAETSELIGGFLTEGKPTALALSADTGYVAVGTEKGSIDVWSLADSRQTARYRRGHTYEIKQIAFSQDDAYVISADTLQIKQWFVDGGEQESVTVASPATGQVKVTTDGLHAVAVLENGQLGVWNLRSGELESTLPEPDGRSFGNADIGRAERIALASQGPDVLAWNKKLLCVWNLITGECVGTWKASEGRQPGAVEIRDAAITGDGTGVVYLDGVDVSFWSPKEDNSRVLGTYDDDPPGYVAISPDGKFALSSGGDRQIHLWRLSGPPNPHVEGIRRIRAMKRELGMLRSTFDPDASYWPDSRDKPSRMLFTGLNEAIVTTGDGILFLIDIYDDPSDVPTLEGSRIPEGHSGGISRMLVHRHLKLLVTSAYDGSVKLWNLRKRCCTDVLNDRPGTVQQLSASAEHILLNTQDGLVNIVRVRDGSLVAAFQGDKQIVSSDSDPEFRHVVALDQSGQMHFLHLEPD
jgi:WD40 repeat protein